MLRSHDAGHARFASDRAVASAVAGPMAAAARAGHDSTLVVVGAGGGGKTWSADSIIAALSARLCHVASSSGSTEVVRMSQECSATSSTTM